VKFLQDNILLIAVAFVSGAMLIWPYVRRATGGPSVSPSQATQLINREDALASTRAARKLRARRRTAR
jgi:hypothetical protein